MDKKYTAEEMKEMLKKASEMASRTDEELSLDDLEGVSGGFSYSINSNDVSLSFTDEEYNLLKGYLDDPMAKQLIAQFGLGDISLARNMTLPLKEGKTIVNLLKLYFK